MRNQGEPYSDTFHWELNQVSTGGGIATSDPPFTSSSEPPRTRWLNMGYWKSGSCSFPEACEALALQVVRAGRCTPDGCVLDVGHASGDSLLLQLGTRDDVPRPSVLVGITSMRSHHLEARDRVEHYLRRQQESRSDFSPIRVDLFVGDAVFTPSTLTSPSDLHCTRIRAKSSASAGETIITETVSRPHPLDPTNDNPTARSPSTATIGSAEAFTSILALDCAYHFHTRSEFLSQCFSRLRPGGSIGLADMCLVRRPSECTLTSPWTFLVATFSLLIARIMTLILSVPWDNMISPLEYEAQLREIGYVNISVQDISEHVFPGFVGFLCGLDGRKNDNKLGVKWWIFGKVIEAWWKLAGGRFVLVSAQRSVL